MKGQPGNNAQLVRVQRRTGARIRSYDVHLADVRAPDGMESRMTPLRRTLTVLACLILSAAASAEPVPITSGPNLFSSPVVIRSGPGTDLRMAFLSNFYSTVIVRSLVLGRSIDDGQTWTLWVGPGGSAPPDAMRVPTYQSGSPSLIERNGVGFLLFYDYGFNFNFHLRRSQSSDGLTFADGSILDMGWNTGIEDQPRVIADGDDSLTMVYRRPIAEGAASEGLYLSRSADNGLAWDALHTLASPVGRVPDLVHRASDGLYLLCYLVDLPAGGYQIFVKSTHDPRDWSSPARLVAEGSVNSPSLTNMPDGAFVMVWGRGDNTQSDIVMSRSTDGFAWSPEVVVAGSPGLLDAGPFALAGPSPGVVDLYWSTQYEVGSSFESQIFHDNAVVVLDPVFAGSFDP